MEGKHLPIVPSWETPVKNGRKPVKDVIKIHKPYQFSDEQYTSIALIDPNITIDFVERGKVVRKVRPVIKDYIVGRVRCGNDACITNLIKESVKPRQAIQRNGEGYSLRCDYCDHTDTLEEVYDKNRFIYIKN